MHTQVEVRLGQRGFVVCRQALMLERSVEPLRTAQQDGQIEVRWSMLGSKTNRVVQLLLSTSVIAEVQ
jgi:hypothetical protein